MILSRTIKNNQKQQELMKNIIWAVRYYKSIMYCMLVSIEQMFAQCSYRFAYILWWLTVVQYSCMGWVILWFLYRPPFPAKKHSWHISKLKHFRHRYLQNIEIWEFRNKYEFHLWIYRYRKRMTTLLEKVKIRICEWTGIFF